jgi:Glycosyl transferase family 2
MSRLSRLAGRTTSVTTVLGSALAVTLTAHTAVNLRRLRRPAQPASEPAEALSVLLPVRDEAHRVEAGLAALLTAIDRYGDRAELVVLDDGSTDGTADVVRRVAEAHPCVRLVDGAPLPAGWLGKPHACWQLAQAADPGSTVLAFVDADVVLTPDALAASIELMRQTGLDLVCPYPRQLAVSAAERLVQPLLQWSWLTTLPLRLAERSPRPSLSAGNGQFLVVDRATYLRAGGHAAVRAEVLEDVALVRAVKAAGGSGGLVDGTSIATCRMYDGWLDLRDGYSKSLWSAFGSPAGAAGVMTLLATAYVLPPVAAVLRRSPVGLAGYAAAVVGRVLVARRTRSRVWPDSLAHPLSIAVLGALTGRSWWLRSRGTLRWKGRDLP